MINTDTILIVKHNWITPYNSYKEGDSAPVSYWAKKVGVDVETFIKDFEIGLLNYWYKIREEND